MLEPKYGSNCLTTVPSIEICYDMMSTLSILGSLESEDRSQLLGLFMPCVGSWKESLHRLSCSPHERNSLASSICRASQWQISLLLLKAPQCPVAHGIQVDAQAKGRRWREALASLRRWRELGFEVSVVSVGAATTGLAHCAVWRQALGQLALEVNTYVANAALSACCRARLLAQGLQLWRRMERRGPAPDVVSLNTLLSLCASEQLAARATELFACAKSSHVEPNLLSLNLFLTALQRAASWSESLSLCRATDGDGITSNLALAACMRSMQWQRSLTFHTTRSLKGSKELLVAHSTIGSGMIESAAWLSAFEMMENLRQLFLEADSESYAVLGSSCMMLAKGEHEESASSWAIANQLLRAAKLQLVHLNEVFLGSSIGSYSRSQQWELGGEVLEAMRSSSLRLNVLAYNLMGSNEWQKSQKLLRRMSRVQLEPDQATWSSLLVSKASESLWRSCSHILELVSSHGTVDQLLRSLHLGAMNSSPWPLATRALRHASETALEPDRILLSRVLTKAWRHGLAFGPSTSSKLRNAWLSACLEGSAWPSAVALLKAPLDGKGLSAALTACGWRLMLQAVQGKRSASEI